MKEVKDDRDLIYLCGLFDGEGYAGISKSMFPNSPYANFSPCISIEMTDFEPLVALQNYFGGRIYLTRHRKGKISSRRWRCKTSQIDWVANSLLKYVIIPRKRRVLECVVSCVKTRKYIGTHVPYEVMELRQQLYDECRLLNSYRESSSEDENFKVRKLQLTLEFEN